MLRLLTASLFTVSTHAALAHPGHVESVANHTHIVEYSALLAIAAAVVVGVLKFWRSSHV